MEGVRKELEIGEKSYCECCAYSVVTRLRVEALTCVFLARMISVMLGGIAAASSRYGLGRRLSVDVHMKRERLRFVCVPDSLWSQSGRVVMRTIIRVHT